MSEFDWPIAEWPIEFGDIEYGTIGFFDDMPTLWARMGKEESWDDSKEVPEVQERLLEPAAKVHWTVSGVEFGRWVVIGPSYRNLRGKLHSVRCMCACGTVRPVIGFNLVHGLSVSCGCWQGYREKRKTHGMSRTRIYSQWACMMERCSNRNNPGYRNYGGRGITVCERWLKFDNFYADMGERPRGMSLDRVDNDGPYSKENCKWSTRKEQSRNTRRNRFITIEGVTKPLIDWVEYSSLRYGTVLNRIRLGWEPLLALTRPSLMEGI